MTMLSNRVETFAHVNGVDLAYELLDFTDPWRTDEPETVLLHHGYSRNKSFWTHWVPLLAGHFRLLRFDERGCGASSKPKEAGAYTVAELTRDAIGLMDRLAIDKVHWVGESSGGIVGMSAALDHPGRLRSLTMMNTPFRRPKEATSAYTLGEPDFASAIRKYGVGGFCRQTIDYRIDRSKAPSEMVEWYIAEMDKTEPHIAIAYNAELGRGDLWPRLPEVRVPILMLTSQSKLAKEDEMEAMRERLPDARLVAIEGYGHGIHLIAAERCVKEMLAFLGIGPDTGRSGRI